MGLGRQGLCGLALLAALAGCEQGAGGNLDNLDSPFSRIFPDGTLPENLREPRFTIDVVLESLVEGHVARPTARELVEAGFARLQVDDPELSFDSRSGGIATLYRGDVIHRIAPPPDDGFPYPEWAAGVVGSMNAYLAALPFDSGVSRKQLAEDFLTGIAAHLGPLTTYYPQDVVDQFGELAAFNLGTLDIVLEPAEAGLRISQIADFALLDRPDLNVGDIVTAIDGVAAAGLSPAAQQRLLNGPVGSRIALTLRDADKPAPRTLELERRAQELASLRATSQGSLLHIRLLHFDIDSDEELKAVLDSRLGRAAPAVEGLILDLRGNPGGWLNTVVDTIDIFAKQWLIFSTHGPHEDSHQEFRAHGSDRSNGLPLVVLVDAATMSGAEITALALQDSGRAVVIGETTKGQGLIRSGLRMATESQMLYPWAEVYAPAGYRLDQRGVLPAVCTGGKTTAAAVLSALRSGGGIIGKATRDRDVEPTDAAAVRAFRALCPPRSDGADVSLDVAQALLADPALYTAVLEGAGR